MKKTPGHHAWDHDGAWRVCRFWADRFHDAGGRAVRIPVNLGDRAGHSRHHRLHGNVRPGGRRCEGACLRRGAYTPGNLSDLPTLIASNLLNLITCAAELGGIAIVLRLLTGWPEKLLLVGLPWLLARWCFLFRFQWIERTFGLSGLMMIVFAVSAVSFIRTGISLAAGSSRRSRNADARQLCCYWYFAVGIFSAMLMEYEVHFYSSGAIEEDWTPKDLGENFMVASLGSYWARCLPSRCWLWCDRLSAPWIFPQTLSSALFSGAFPLRKKPGAAIAGSLACISGAAVETALSGGYNVCQFFNLRLG